MGERYRALRILAEIYRFLGLLMFVAAFVTLFFLLIPFTIAFAFGGLGSLSIAELIRLLIDVAENTRRTAEALEERQGQGLDRVV